MNIPCEEDFPTPTAEMIFFFFFSFVKKSTKQLKNHLIFSLRYPPVKWLYNLQLQSPFFNNDCNTLKKRHFYQVSAIRNPSKPFHIQRNTKQEHFSKVRFCC